MTQGLDRSLIKVSLILLLGAMAALLDTTMISVALADLRREFGASPSTLQLVSTVYLLAMAAVIPLMGWSVERWGGKAMWMASIALFLLGSLLCGAAWSVASLVAFRVVQGVGGGLILPLMQAILADQAGPHRFGRAMSLVAIPGQLAPIVGPALGGLILDSAGWRWLFYSNLPVCLVALASAWKGLPASRPGRAPTFDLPGFLLFSPGLALLVYGLSLVGNSGAFLSGPAAPYLGIGTVLAAGFAAIAYRKGGAALIDLSLLHHRPYAAAAALMFLFGIAIYGPMFLLPLYSQLVRGDDALAAGMALAPQGIGTMLGIAAAGRWSDRSGPRPLVLTGIVITALATLAYTRLDVDTSRTVLAIALFIRGIGLGTAGIPVMAAAYHGLTTAQLPGATPGVHVIQRLGASLGTAVLAVVLQRRLALSPGTGGAGPEPAPVADPELASAAAFNAAFGWATAFTVIALLPALILPRHTPSAREGMS